MYLIFEGLLLIALAGLIIAFYHGLFVWIFLFKTTASLLFVLSGSCGYRKSKEGWTFSQPMLIAFICCLVGDVLLALDKKQGILFVLGVVSFAGAHILFSFAFCQLSTILIKDIIAALVIFIGLALLLLLGSFDFHGLLPVLMGYSAIISFMTVKALSLWRRRRQEKSAAVLMMLGGVSFLLSDIVLLFWLFGRGMPGKVQSANWILYYLAQGCLTASLSARKKSWKEMLWPNLLVGK